MAALKALHFSDFQSLLDAVERRQVQIGGLERFEFYEKTRDAFVVVPTATGHPVKKFWRMHRIVMLRASA